MQHIIRPHALLSIASFAAGVSSTPLHAPGELRDKTTNQNKAARSKVIRILKPNNTDKVVQGRMILGRKDLETKTGKTQL